MVKYSSKRSVCFMHKRAFDYLAHDVEAETDG